MAVGGYTTAALVVPRALARRLDDPARRRRRRASSASCSASRRCGSPGIYLALATFAFAVAMPSLLKKFAGFTGGGQGLRLFEQAPLQVTGLSGTVTIFGHSTDPEPLPLLPDLGDRRSSAS